MQIHTVVLGHLACLVLRDLSLFHQVYFVSYDNHWRVLILHFVDTLNPIVDCLESFFTCHVESENDSICLPVKLVSDVTEFFLTCRVPNLHLDSAIVLLIMIISHDVLYGNGLQMIRYEFSFVQPSEKTSFADSSIPDDDQVHLWHYHFDCRFFYSLNLNGTL